MNNADDTLVVADIVVADVTEPALDIRPLVIEPYVEILPADNTDVPSVRVAPAIRVTAVILEATARDPALEIVPLVMEPRVDRMPLVNTAWPSV